MLAFLLLCPLLRSLRSLLIFRISFTNKLHAIHNVQRFRLCVREREGKRLSTLDRWLLPFVRCSCSWFSYSMSNVLMFIVDFNSKCLCTIYAIYIHIAIESRLFTLPLSFGLPFSGYIFVELGNLWLYDQYFSSFIACGFDYSFMYCGL